RGRSRPLRVVDPVAGVIFVLPKQRATRRIQAKHSLCADNRTVLRSRRFTGLRPRTIKVHHKQSATGDRWPGISRTDRCSPIYRRTAIGKLLENPSFTPDAIT